MNDQPIIECAVKVIPVYKEIKLLGITLHEKLKFDSNIANVCRKVGSQINVLSRLKNILPCKTKDSLYGNISHSTLWKKEYRKTCKTKDSLYGAFISPYCSQVWYHCGRRNIEKLERTNATALRFVYSDKISTY